MRTGEELIAAGYLQTSRQYRMVGRSPPGRSAMDVLYDQKMKEIHDHVGLPKEMVEYWKVLAHLKSIQGSFAPKHEHKQAAVAYLASRWLESAEWTDASGERKRVP